MGHNGSEDTCLHQTDAQGLQLCRTRRSKSLDRQRLTVDPSKLGNGSQSIRDGQRIQTGTNKHTYICIRTLHHSKKNIIKHAKIELATIVTRRKETRQSELRSRSYRVYTKQVLVKTFDST